MAEAFDVADRGSFYDRTGAIRDVVQNHMLQVLASVLADAPAARGHDAWRKEKAELIGSLRPLTPADTVKGQYEGYLDVAGVAPGSTHRDLRRGAARGRLAAVGRRPDRDPGRQVHAGHRDRGRHPLPPVTP